LWNEIRAGRTYAQPETAARKLVKIAAGIKPVQEDRIYIELVNWPFLTEFKGSQQNTEPASSSRSSVGGSGCTRAGRI
jgi:hypothetical protein